MANELLVAWIGRADLKAASGELGIGLGPIAQAVSAGQYQGIHLLCDFPQSESKPFLKWITPQTKAKIHLHNIKLLSPIDFGEIYESVVTVLDEISKQETNLTFHLSPGTPTMAAVWILLAKTTYPARLIQSSAKQGVEEANIPFDIAAEFIPQLLKRSDARISALAMGTADQDAVFESIIHRSAPMQHLVEQARRVAIRSIPVLIEGESGTGKELMARAIHHASPRKNKPFIVVNCGAISPELVESEFFGHKKGAFTGAAQDRKGHFELAHDGTIFLDEIGELPKPIQVKLLRTLQEGEVTPVGSSESRKVDVRVVAATNRTLINEVASGNFREDLFYRLAVAIIKLPPLRERAGDLTVLIDALMKQTNEASATIGIKPKNISVSGRRILMQHPWPGNIRELLNTLQRAAVWSDDDTISQEAIKEAILVTPKGDNNNDSILNRPLDSGLKLEEIMANVARHYLRRALKQTKGNKTKAAEILGFRNYQTLTNWMEKYNVEH
jgi:transcriptional regulator with PAS, ATPase and Fis domain